MDLVNWMADGEMVIQKKFDLRLQIPGPFLRRQNTFGEKRGKVMSLE